MNSALKFLLVISMLGYPDGYAQGRKPVPVIFDTDMGPDYDDVGPSLYPVPEVAGLINTLMMHQPREK